MTLNSRLLDNHFDTRLHKYAWIAPGIMKHKNDDYNCDDSGLGFSLKNFYD